MRHSSTTCELKIACFDRERIRRSCQSERNFLSWSTGENFSKSRHRSLPSLRSLLPGHNELISTPLPASTEHPSLSEAKREAQFLSSKMLSCILCHLGSWHQITALSYSRWVARPCTFNPLYLVTCNGIHIMLHWVALTSTVVVTADYRLQPE